MRALDYTPGGDVDVLSSVAAPDKSNIEFGIGTSQGIMTLDKRSNLTWLSREQCGHKKDVFAVEFLSHEPDVIMSGGRNSFMYLTDLRVPSFGQQPDFIKHGSSITHIKQVDTHRIIVAGLKSNLCQYDLRFRKGPERTQSILQYPAYQNSARMSIGFDVDTESGIVAAAQEFDASHPLIQLFSLHGGHTLPSCFNLGEDAIAAAASGAVVPWLRFVSDVEGKMKSL